ncbi:hypothetical protein [Autumnicola musiva]|uniref:3-oxoacyl-ACP synthase n=1 Tax=Autumnicola musiva TaxID=3075589 RepID=A0ABU3D740_9FLAO|nr:hypothetical protein [Zunongwangia sp. F117]MDT0677333.1 hypothetical protein [Zunongwangia sp. F117]
MKKRKMGDKPFFIEALVAIKSNVVYRNGEEIFRRDHIQEPDAFIKEFFKNLKVKYPKFHKMDVLSKLGFLASEVLLKDKYVSPDTALIFSNSASSMETDRQYRASMEDFPSPSLFVYTLPNIVLGEISIRHRLQSENAFFVSEKFNPHLIHTYTTGLLKNEMSPAAVCGWLDLKNKEYDVFLILISENGKIPFTEENLQKTYYFDNE